MRRLLCVVFACVVGSLAAASNGWALAKTFTGSSGLLEATVTFEVVGTDLHVTLANTSSADVLEPVGVLTAVFFQLDGAPTLTPFSAFLSPGSTVVHGTTPPGGDVGGEWAYNPSFTLTGEVGSFQGISSTGLDIFGPDDLFPPQINLSGPASPDGLQYGILSAGDDPNTGNAKVTGGNPLIKNSVDFVLQGLPTGFTVADVSNVLFQYGTDLSEPRFPGNGGGNGGVIPEPGTLLLLGTGLLGLGGLARRRSDAARKGRGTPVA